MKNLRQLVPLMTLGLVSAGINPESLKEDTGYAEMNLGENGEPVRTVRRPAGYDLVKEGVRNSDGTWTIQSYVPERV